MPSKDIRSALGLYRTPNQLSGAQDGGYQSLENCVIRSKDVIEPRRGQTQVSAWIGSNSSDTRRINSLFQSSVGLLAQFGSGTASGVGSVDDVFVTSILTDVDPPSAWVRTRFADQSKRCYVTTDGGLKRIDSALSGKPAGGPLCISTSEDLSRLIYSASGQIAANSAVMYRAEIVRFAPDGSEIVGPPSQRLYLRCSANKSVDAGQITRTGGTTCTVNTTSAHGYSAGQVVYLNVSPDDANFPDGSKTIDHVVDEDTFVYSEAGANVSSANAATVSAGAAYASLQFRFRNAIAGDVLRVYRSEASSSATSMPLDDTFQVYEAKLTSTDISNGYVAITDNTPAVLLGDTSYFSSSVEGEIGSNDTPPLAWDVCALGDALLLGNLTYPNSLELRLLATGGSAGIINGTTLTFTRSGYDTFTITATNTGSPTDLYFALYDYTSVATGVEMTARAIVHCINTSTDNDWLDAHYISRADSAPGTILLTTRDFVSTTFTVTSDKGTAWAPNILSTGTATASKQEVADADIAISKSGQPDAFPGIQRLRVGAPGEKILRVLQVRDKAIVLKEASAWLVSGAWPQLRVELLDDTVEFPLPDTAAVMDGQVFCLSSIGVVAVSEGGVANMGAPIEGEFRAVVEQALRTRANLNAGYANIHCLASWGAVDELEHRYLLGVPASVGAPSATPTTAQQIDNIWVFNASAKAWSGPWPCKHRHAATWKGGSSSSRLVFARQDKPGVLKEAGLDGNTVLQFSDYFAESFYIETKSGTTLGLLSSSGGAPTVGSLEVGDALYVSSTGFAAVIASVVGVVDPGGGGVMVGRVTVDDASGLQGSMSGVLVLKGYTARAEPVPVYEGPVDKQCNSIHLEVSDARFVAGKVYGGSELSGDILAKTLSRPGFGSESFGEDGDAIFGGVEGLHKERAQFPKDAQRGVFHRVAFQTREAGAFWRLHALNVDFEAQGVKGTR